MPIYEYRCDDCKQEFEQILDWPERSIPTDTPCSKCGGKVNLKMSLGNFKLMGSGWYKDGYQSKSNVENEDVT